VEEDEGLENDSENPFYGHTLHRQPPVRDDGRWEMNIKLEIPELNSILQAEEFIDWLDIVEKTSRIFQMRKRSNWMLLD
jgi:hypothetical protein